jgi:hypothetical protein
MLGHSHPPSPSAYPDLSPQNGTIERRSLIGSARRGSPVFLDKPQPQQPDRTPGAGLIAQTDPLSEWHGSAEISVDRMKQEGAAEPKMHEYMARLAEGRHACPGSGLEGTEGRGHENP